jgi:hypothetical protein
MLYLTKKVNNMKKIMILILMLQIGSVIQAADETMTNYIVVGDETFYCEKVFIGKSSTRIYVNGNQVIKFPTYLVDAYELNGKYFEKLPVVNKKQDTAGWAFMQFIATRGEYKLYRYCSNCVHYDPSTDQICPDDPVFRYYIFKDGKYVTIADDRNVKNLLNKFGVKLVG